MFACPEAELRRTVVNVRNELPRNVPPILPRRICETGQFEQYPRTAFTRTLDKKREKKKRRIYNGEVSYSLYPCGFWPSPPPFCESLEDLPLCCKFLKSSLLVTQYRRFGVFFVRLYCTQNVKILFLQKFDFFFCFTYLFNYKHQSV